ncbi:hypothetical protein P4O66_022261, partial [Electrophorus voltai]
DGPSAVAGAASSFSFCRAALDHTVSAEELNYQLPRKSGGNLTWHDSHSQRAAGRTVKLLQQPGTEGIPAKKDHGAHRGCAPDWSRREEVEDSPGAAWGVKRMLKKKKKDGAMNLAVEQSACWGLCSFSYDWESRMPCE